MLVLADQPLVVDLISLTLNHGAFVTRDVPTLDDAKTVVAEWQPHVAVIDMDLGGPAVPPSAATRRPAPRAVPILALTRRGDLKRKLEAFDQGVDDVLTVPFSPEELLARVVVITRRTYGTGSGRPVGAAARRDRDRHRQSPGHRRWVDALHLTALDQSLLYLLAANAGRVVVAR